MLGVVGTIPMLLAFVAAAVSVIAGVVGYALRNGEWGETLSWASRVAAIITFVGLSVSVVALAYGFLTDYYDMQYILDNHVTTTGAMGILFRISGVWAGRQGSLLFWAWLISLFGFLVTIKRINEVDQLDNLSTLIIQLVIAAFIGIMLFSEDNSPFLATDEAYYDSEGSLGSALSLTGMNILLQHWAMAIHPPMLFAGYAGLTVPFAYALAAAITNNSSDAWVRRSQRYAVGSWLFLSIGIGLGAAWAYSVLGWGGYWGWDPVENASLLPWLVCIALIHSFTQYRARGQFKCWAMMCACLAFCFCILGTFITRSGLVESVHAFAGDPVSLVLFGALIIVSVLAGAIACIARRKSFAPAAEVAETESMASRDMASYVNNLVTVIMAVLLAYLTVAQALPSFLPFGGTSVSTGTYNAIARPIGTLYLLLMAVCPMLGWRKTDRSAFFKKAKVPGICAIVVFVLLMVYAFAYLFPCYDSIIDAGGSAADELLSDGPTLYYKGLTIVGFAVASLLFMNSLFQLGRVAGIGKNAHTAKLKLRAAGGFLSHTAMAIVLVGLICSSMYVFEQSGYIAYDSDTDTATETFQVKGYTLVYTGSETHEASNGYVYYTKFNVRKDGELIGTVQPSITVTTMTSQQQLNAGVLRLPGEDLFVVFKGLSEDDDALSMDVLVNPMINFVWVGFVLLAAGMLLSLVGRRELES